MKILKETGQNICDLRLSKDILHKLTKHNPQKKRLIN